MQYEHFDCDIRDGIAHIRLIGPDAPLPAAMCDEFLDLLLRLQDDNAVRVLLVTDGDNSFDLIRHLTLYHSPNGSNEDFEAQAKWVADKAREYGLADVKVFWVGGTDRPWNVHSGEAWIVEPEITKLGDTLESPLRVATNSRSADVTAELVDVGTGTAEADYQGRHVEGKIVLGSGSAQAVHALAVWKFGAEGVIAYAPQRPYFPDQAALTSIPYRSDDGKDGTFAFILTQREGDGLHARLEELKRAGKTVRVRVNIKTSFNEPRQGIAEAWIRGTNPQNDDIVLTAHMQEEKTSANDDRSGVANLLEIGRCLNKLIAEGKLERPRRNIRFWWVDEIGAEYRYLAENPEAAGTMLANLNQDMVGAKQSEGERVQFMSRTPFSRPSFLNDLGESVVNAVVWGNTVVPLREGANSSDFSRPMFAEQCMDITPCRGSRKFRMVKTDFLISPAYAVLPMMAIFFSNDRQMNVSLPVLSTDGVPLKDGMAMMVNSGTKRLYSSSDCGSRNMLRTKWLCQASSVTTRTGSR